MSNRLRDATRGGFLSSFSVPLAGIDTLVAPVPPGLAPQLDGSLLRGTVSVAKILSPLGPLQNSPIAACWSPSKANAEAKSGTAPATSPLSYRQLKPTQ